MMNMSSDEDVAPKRWTSWAVRAAAIALVVVVVLFAVPRKFEAKHTDVMLKAARKMDYCVKMCGEDVLADGHEEKAMTECMSKCEKSRAATKTQERQEGEIEKEGRNGETTPEKTDNPSASVQVRRDLSRTNVGIYVIENGQRWYMRMGHSGEGYRVNAVPHLQAWERWDVIPMGYHSYTGSLGSHGTISRGGWTVALRNRQFNRYVSMKCGGGESSARKVTSHSSVGDAEKFHFRESPHWTNYWRIFNVYHSHARYDPCYLQIWSGGVHASGQEHVLGSWLHFT